MIEGKACCLPIEWNNVRLVWKYKTRLEVNDSDKHVILLRATKAQTREHLLKGKAHLYQHFCIKLECLLDCAEKACQVRTKMFFLTLGPGR